MIIISATLNFETKEQRDKAVEITADIQLATRQEEEGCISYCFAADPCVDNRIQVYEKNTAVLADFYQAQSKLENVNGVGTVDEVMNRIFSAIDN